MPYSFEADSEQAQAHLEVTNTHHEAKLSHELLAGAASFEAFKALEDHKAKEGKPVSHAMAKELLVGFAGAFIDRQVESRGMDLYEAEKAKRHAHSQIEEGMQYHPDCQF
ncbi:putative CipC-like antibiotic response protein [Lentinula raphanica]|nr:putative CipC-like antibiotic response protein [Lentinula raphanica]KAJ3777241.1 putative CipC-like antibiotic response protein [Lentinula raphanica]